MIVNLVKGKPVFTKENFKEYFILKVSKAYINSINTENPLPKYYYCIKELRSTCIYIYCIFYMIPFFLIYYFIKDIFSYLKYRIFYRGIIK